MKEIFELPSQVYKAYDIRGIVPTELNTQFALLLGRASLPEQLNLVSRAQ